MKDFFISYTKSDREWAEWIAWILEENGYTTILQAWDFRPGSNFVLEMDRAAREADRTIAVLSQGYLDALYTHPEWAAAFAQDPKGEKGTLLPVCVRDCDPDALKGLLGPIIHVNIKGLSADAAKQALLEGIHRGRAKPSGRPPFPPDADRSAPARPSFPGALPPIQNVPCPPTPPPLSAHPIGSGNGGPCDVFVSYSHEDSKLVEALAQRLVESGFSVWFDKWSLIPGVSWQQGMAQAMNQAACCAVCVGSGMPAGWFDQEIQHALNRQTQEPAFRVIPILLPGADPVNVDGYLELRTWVDFRKGLDDAYAFHLLCCGIRNERPGRATQPGGTEALSGSAASAMKRLARLRALHDQKLIHDSVWLEKQTPLVDIVVESEDGND